MIYKQEVLEKQLLFRNSIISEKILSYSGVCEDDDNTKRIYSSYPMQKMQIEEMEPNKLNLIFERIRDYERILKERGVEIQAYLKTHFETIEINQINDKRDFGLLRLIFCCCDNKYVDELYLKDNECINKIQESVVRNTEYIDMKQSGYGKKINGAYTTLMGPRASGYFCHEIIGHLLEDDNYMFSKCFLENIKLPDKINVIDDITGVENIIGLNKYDDTGVLIRPIRLICNGVIENVISMSKNNKALYGMGRRQNYQKQVMPRMRNTIFEGKDNIMVHKLNIYRNELIWLSDVYTGGVNIMNGDYILRGRGWRIVNGEKRNPIDNLLIKGNALKDLSNIILIGNDYQTVGGECCKIGNIVRVGMTGPSVLFSELKIQGETYGKY